MAIDRNVREEIKLPKLLAPEAEWRAYEEEIDRRYALLSKEEKEKLELYNRLKLRGEI